MFSFSFCSTMVFTLSKPESTVLVVGWFFFSSSSPCKKGGWSRLCWSKSAVQTGNLWIHSPWAERRDEEPWRKQSCHFQTKARSQGSQGWDAAANRGCARSSICRASRAPALGNAQKKGRLSQGRHPGLTCKAAKPSRIRIPHDSAVSSPSSPSSLSCPAPQGLPRHKSQAPLICRTVNACSNPSSFEKWAYFYAQSILYLSK